MCEEESTRRTPLRNKKQPLSFILSNYLQPIDSVSVGAVGLGEKTIIINMFVGSTVFHLQPTFLNIFLFCVLD